MTHSTERIIKDLSLEVLSAAIKVAQANSSVVESCGQGDTAYRFRLPNGDWVVIGISVFTGF